MLLMLPMVSFGAKKDYKITFVVDGCKDSVVYMGYYLAQNRYFCDTAYNNGKGKFVFEGNKELKPGLYYLTNNVDRYVEFVVYHEKQRFTLHTSQDNWELGMTVKDSKENEVFFNFHRAEETFYQAMDEAAARSWTPPSSTMLRPALYPCGSTVCAWTSSTSTPTVCSRDDAGHQGCRCPTEHPDGTPMSYRERYEWLMDHFFDNMPLDDPFILRTPKEVFYDRVMEYVDQRMNRMPPDMICPLLDSLIDRAEPAPEVYRWLILNLTEHFLQSRIMVYDEVYVHLVQRYFATGKVEGLAPSVIDEQIERATKWDRLLVGKVAPELVLFDTTHRAASLHHMPGDYTLLLFWSPTCGHCRDIIPAVYKVYEQYAESLKVSAFAILTEPDDHTVVKWKTFLADHHMSHPRWVNLNGGEANVDWREVYDITTTPQIYLIDNRDHKFVAKKLSAEILEAVLQAIIKNNE